MFSQQVLLVPVKLLVALRKHLEDNMDESEDVYSDKLNHIRIPELACVLIYDGYDDRDDKRNAHESQVAGSATLRLTMIIFGKENDENADDVEGNQGCDTDNLPQKPSFPIFILSTPY